MLQEREQQLTKLKAQLNNEQVKENNEEVLTMIQKNEIKDYLLMNLEDVKSKEELFQLAKSFNISESNFNIIFNELCQEYNMASNTLGFPKYYQLMPLKVPKNQTFFLPTNEKQIDILMIADLHIRNVSNYLKSLMYLLNNYAIKNNISLATILGDIYDIRWDDFDKNKYDFIKFWEKNAFQLKREIDKSSLNYLILGGNHDERALLDGIDLIKYLEDDCENVKSLGYQDASLVLGEVKKSENKIGLHHTGKHVILPKPVFISEFENRKIKEYLNNLYLNESRSYFDFFGHFHYDYLNLRDGYSLINNFPNATSPIKAYHLSFYLNDKLNIDRMIIKPLAIYCDEFLSVNEISYQKVRKI